MSTIKSIERKLDRGERLSPEDALLLLKSDDIHGLGMLADRATRTRHSNRVTFVRNRHINPTNVCVNRCTFCAFSRSSGEDDAFELDIDAIVQRADQAAGEGAVELHIVGGLHPDRPFSFYSEMLATLAARHPTLHLKAFTAVEIDYFTKISGLSLKATIAALRDAGFDDRR